MLVVEVDDVEVELTALEEGVLTGEEDDDADDNVEETALVDDIVGLVDDVVFVEITPVEEPGLVDEAKVAEDAKPVEDAGLVEEDAGLVEEVVPLDGRTLAEAVVLVDETAPVAEVVESVLEIVELPDETWTNLSCDGGTTADDVATPDVAVLADATLDVALTLGIDEDDGTAAFWYMFKRLGPPQYSVALPEQTMLHVVTAGESPATSVEPVLMTLPQ